ncbi:MAG: adenylyltransferase/cytidyltransferase family protein [Candidatus Diapherotrites archaeon]|nr:adenylyltransferase/cytidyltransferase family protein [Candidatus Diapherotrites archaeon]
MERAIFIGRFQPLHKGHLHALSELGKHWDVTIIVGSSESRRTAENPLSFEERKVMIRTVTAAEVIGVPDVFNAERWAQSIRSMIDFSVVVSGNAWTRACFKDCTVIDPPFLEPETYNSSRIRGLVRRGEPWEHLVPAEVAQYLQSNDLLRWFR